MSFLTRFMLSLVVALGLFVFGALYHAARAETPPCMSPDRAVEELRQVLPNVKITRIDTEPAQAFIAWFNAIPPQSNAVGDLVVIAQEPSIPGAAVVIFRDGCYVGRGMLPAELIENALNTFARGA